MLEGLLGECPYKSPTDMGVNMIGFCITDDEAVSEAAKQESFEAIAALFSNIAEIEKTHAERFARYAQMLALQFSMRMPPLLSGEVRELMKCRMPFLTASIQGCIEPVASNRKQMSTTPLGLRFCVV